VAISTINQTKPYIKDLKRYQRLLVKHHKPKPNNINKIEIVFKNYYCIFFSSFAVVFQRI
jgi:hypothetical protein